MKFWTLGKRPAILAGTVILVFLLTWALIRQPSGPSFVWRTEAELARIMNPPPRKPTFWGFAWMRRWMHLGARKAPPFQLPAECRLQLQAFQSSASRADLVPIGPPSST